MTLSDIQAKTDSLRSLLREHNLDAVLLQQVSSFAWATDGAASYVNMAATNGPSSLLITAEGERLLVTNNIEAPRLEREELLGAQGWRFHIAPWHRASQALAKLTQGMALGADGPYPGAVDLSSAIARLRARLTPAEGERFRTLGRLCAEAMAAAARSVRPGQTEYEIAARLASEAQQRGVQPILNLVACDERVYSFRHPLPTDKAMDRYAMLALGGRQRGLVCSLTRLVHLGPLPAELRRRAEAVARVDATLIAHTRPNRTLSEVLAEGIAAYANVGFAGEWERHHQGGAAGYESREYKATPGSTEVIELGQAFAWNPSIEGTKSEDTILVGEAGPEVLTAMPDWPTLSVEVAGRQIARPAILEPA